MSAPLDELTVVEAIAAYDWLRTQVDATEPRRTKAKDVVPAEQLAAHREAEERLERFLEAVDPGNARRAVRAQEELGSRVVFDYGF